MPFGAPTARSAFLIPIPSARILRSGSSFLDSPVSWISGKAAMLGTGNTQPQSLKANVAAEAIRRVRRTAQIARLFDAHPNRVGRRKRQALKQLPTIFAGTHPTRQRSDAEREALYRRTARLQLELDFLKEREVAARIEDKRRWVDRFHTERIIRRQCRLPGLARSSY
jgi:transposase-like protein